MKTKIIFLLIFAASVAAQNDKPEAIVMQHKKALLFSINEFRLESFNGGVGLKFWTSERFALLGKINYSYSKSERDKTEKLTGNIDKDISYGASIGFEKHISIVKSISPYFGLSIGVGFENKNEKVNTADYLGTIYTNERTTSSYALSANLSLGADFF